MLTLNQSIITFFEIVLPELLTATKYTPGVCGFSNVTEFDFRLLFDTI